MRFSCVIVPLCAVLLAACGRRETGVRTYVEVGGPIAPVQTEMPAAAGAGMAAAMAAEGAPPALVWTAPAGWKETPGTGFRVVSFEAEGADCAVIAFPAAMGGTEEKISMWLSQLNAANPPPEKMIAFVARPEKIESGSLVWNVYDLTPLVPVDAPASILAALTTIEGRPIAVRLKGGASALKTHREAFLSLIRSIGRKPNG